ncbi:hypothetical protein Tco_0453142 [Tanacetum coccineum]
MFCSTLNLPVKTTANPFIAPAIMKYIQPFMQIVGYQGDVDKVSAFFTKNLAQPWKTMFKVFNRCLTSRTSGHDKTKINILEIFHVVVNRVHVDYAALLCDTPIPPPKPGSHNEHPEIVDDDDENKKEKKDNDKDDDVNDDYIDHTLDKTQEMGSLETRNEQTCTPILSPHRSPRTILSSDKTISKELTDNESPLTSTRSQGQSKTRRISSKYTHIPQALRRIYMRQDIMIKKMEKKFVTNHDFQAIHKNVDNVLHDVIPKIASNATNDIFEDNLPKVLVKVSMKKDARLRYCTGISFSKEFG